MGELGVRGQGILHDYGGMITGASFYKEFEQRHRNLINGVVKVSGTHGARRSGEDAAENLFD